MVPRSDDNLELVTVIECISADGSCLAPFFVFKSAAHPPRVDANWVWANGPSDARYSASATGWTDSELGVEWISYFDEATAELADGPRLLIVDGHGSHISYDFIVYAMHHNITLLCLPPHSTHILQCLDVGIFSPLQHRYARVVEDNCPAAGNVRKADFSR